MLKYCLKAKCCLFNTIERFYIINAFAVCVLKYLMVGSYWGRGEPKF